MRLRVLGVVAVVAALAGLLGAFVGIVFGVVAMLVTTGSLDLGQFTLFAYSVAATVGAANGVVIGSLTSFVLLRHVPLWRAIGETALGASLGAALMMALGDSAPLRLAVGGYAGWLLAPAGALIAAIRLRVAMPTPTEHSRVAG